MTRRYVDKVDLLFVIDDGISAQDKQPMFQQAVSHAVRRLLNPDCVESRARMDRVSAAPDGSCPLGYEREHVPPKDAHIAFIGSSFGGYGGEPCNARPTFVSWNANDRDTSSLDALIAVVREQVGNTAQLDCPFAGQAFSAPLESWYRFLIDPEPPLVERSSGDMTPVVAGTNETLLAERAAFLRPDSFVGIAMISGSDDCSVRSPEEARTLEASSDVNASTAFRCWDHAQRQGKDFLHPIHRYVRALTETAIEDGGGSVVMNPLFGTADGTLRDPTLISLVGVVGVPWQDLATEETRDDPNRLQYLATQDFAGLERWQVVLGKDDLPASDALMRQTADDRTTLGAPAHPLLGIPLSPSSETGHPHPINGREYASAEGNALQYSCIYPLEFPLECDPAVIGCECSPDLESENRPVCESTIQTHAKAYPAERQLEVLRELDGGSPHGLGSLCPKITDVQNPDFGYTPAFSSLFDRLRKSLNGRCLSQSLEPDESGAVPCRVFDLQDGTSCDCGGDGLKATSTETRDVVRNQIHEQGMCGSESTCDDICVCEVEQVTGANLDACRNSPGDWGNGFCYVDPAHGGSAELVSGCSATERRLLRLGLEGSGTTLIICE